MLWFHHGFTLVKTEKFCSCVIVGIPVCGCRGPYNNLAVWIALSNLADLQVVWQPRIYHILPEANLKMNWNG